MEIQENSKIRNLLSKKVNNVLEISDELTSKVLEYDYLGKCPGINLRFLESLKKDEKCGEWNEYNILFSIKKFKDSPDYLGFILEKLGDLIEDICKGVPLDVIGIQETLCSEPEEYYILLYILSDGKEKESNFEDIN